MHPNALLELSAELLRAVLKLDQPADTVVSAFFRRHRGLGARERHSLAETTYTVLRQRLLLQHLAQAGAQVLDLEALACHRGSVLGGLPTQPQPSQKMFESRIWSTMRGFDASMPVFVESESRKVGDLRVPDELIKAMRASSCIQIELDLAERVRLLREEYLHFELDHAALFAQLDCLTALHGRERIAGWKQLAAAGHWEQLVESLLVEHYDPAYLRSISRNFAQVATARIARATSADRSAFEAIARDLTRR